MDFKVGLALVLDALFVSLVGVVGRFASLFIVVAIATTGFTKVLACLFLLGELVFRVRIDKVVHVYHILASAGARRARVGGAQSEPDQVVHAQNVVLTVVVVALSLGVDLDEASAAQILDGVRREETVLVVVVVQMTGRFHDGGLGEQTLAEGRIERDIARSLKDAAGRRGEEKEEANGELHGW